jgi:hypothetical protein
VFQEAVIQPASDLKALERLYLLMSPADSRGSN